MLHRLFVATAALAFAATTAFAANPQVEIDTTAGNGWTVVDMKNDWKSIYPALAAR